MLPVSAPAPAGLINLSLDGTVPTDMKMMQERVESIVQQPLSTREPEHPAADEDSPLLPVAVDRSDIESAPLSTREPEHPAADEESPLLPVAVDRSDIESAPGSVAVLDTTIRAGFRERSKSTPSAPAIISPTPLKVTTCNAYDDGLIGLNEAISYINVQHPAHRRRMKLHASYAQSLLGSAFGDVSAVDLSARITAYMFAVAAAGVASVVATSAGYSPPAAQTLVWCVLYASTAAAFPASPPDRAVVTMAKVPGGHTYMHTHTYIHTYTHIHIHTYIQDHGQGAWCP